jgi:alpha-glucosidase
VQHLLFPHHDGSELYVSNSAPKIGEKVELRVRTPNHFSLDEIYVRYYHDGEPRAIALSPLKSSYGATEKWWSAKVEILNLKTSYRFALVSNNVYKWLTAAGVVDHDLSSAKDFQILATKPFPEWIRSSVFYQIFPDRFAKSGKKYDIPDWMVSREWSDVPKGKDSSTGVEYFGGDLDGVTAHLDHVESLGANGIYFTPLFPANSTHRYDATSFDEVDPLLGGDDALFALQRQAKKKGIRLMGDLTTNHCGRGHYWFTRALKDKDSKERKYFYWDKSIKHGYVGWWGHPSLPKLNYSSKSLRKAMFEGKNSIVKKWLRAPYSMSGWRIDVGNMTGRYLDQDLNQQVMRGIRQSVEEENPEAWLVAENADMFPSDLDGFGWHGTMNYGGFMRPLWAWIRHPDYLPNAGNFGLAIPMAKFDGREFYESLKDFSSAIPWRNFVSSMLLLNSHDTARFRSVVRKDIDRHVAGLTLLMTYPGVPSIFAGDEIGLEGEWGEDARRTINWEDRSGWDKELLQRTTELARIHRTSHALSQGGLRWLQVGEDHVVYLRESKKQNLLIAVSRSGCRLKVDLSSLGYRVSKTLFGPSQNGSKININSRKPISVVVELVSL